MPPIHHSVCVRYDAWFVAVSLRDTLWRDSGARQPRVIGIAAFFQREIKSLVELGKTPEIANGGREKGIVVMW